MATLYVRKGGSNNNSGSSSGTSPQRTGTDGVTAGTTTFTSASANFTADDVGKNINILTKNNYRIATFVNSTTVTLSGSPSVGAGLTWNIGGALLTIGSLLNNTVGGFSSGDTAYVGGGVYREVITVSMTSPTAETSVIADVDGAQTGDMGEVRWTAFTTNDKTAPGAAALDLAGRDFLTFEGISFIGGNANGACVAATTVLSTNCTFRRCSFVTASPQIVIRIGASADLALNWTFDNCVVLPFPGNGLTGACIRIDAPRSAISDYDLNVTIKNCLFLGVWRTGVTGGCVSLASSGAATFGAGGVEIYNCTFMAGSGGVTTNSVTGTTAGNQVLVYNCLFWCTEGLFAAAANQIVEDYNMFYCVTARSNVTAGANSIVGTTLYSPGMHFGQEMLVGENLRPFGSPTLYSPFLGFGHQAGGPDVDFQGLPRPSGPARTWGVATRTPGAYERGNTAEKETTTVRTGSNAIKLLGPAVQDFEVPVDAVSTTISVYGRYDSAYGGGALPKLRVLANAECGVTEETDTMTGAADTWEELSLTFTPTAKGVVTVRLLSDGDGNGSAFFDDFNIA